MAIHTDPGQVVRGVVQTFKAALEGGEALWRVLYDDGDDEDLDELELEAALRLYKKLRPVARTRSGQNSSTMACGGGDREGGMAMGSSFAGLR